MKSLLLGRALLTFLAVTSPAWAGHPFICADSYSGKVCVVSADGKIEWEHACKHPQDFWRLPNGNYLEHGHLGEQPHVFEVTRDKKVVWEFADQTHFKTINQIQLLDVPGDVTKGEVLR
jgi:hypothetical protein